MEFGPRLMDFSTFEIFINEVRGPFTPILKTNFRVLSLGIHHILMKPIILQFYHHEGLSSP